MRTDAKPEPDAKPWPKRQWYQFSLWSIFLWVTVVAVLLAGWLQWIAPARQQRAAVQMVERFGGIVQYANGPKDEAWLTTRLRNLLPRDYFDTVEEVDLTRCSPDLQCLDGLKQLRILSLADSHVADGVLPPLNSSTRLQKLDLHGSHITDSGLLHLRGLTQLEVLYLNETRITDAGLAYLSRHAQLQWLNLEGTQVTYEGVKQLQDALPNCAITTDRVLNIRSP